MRRGKVSFTWMVCNPAMPPATDNAIPLDAVRSCLEQIGWTVDIARRLVEAGKQVDLTGLDSQMGFVCARALDIPPEEGRDLRPAFIDLLRAVDSLSVALRARAPPAS